MEYRRDIDGLRAVAVVPVILFHAGFQTFSGGFIGVDVFFVISGYLITSNILSEKSAGTFSLLTFYERRARRILPALFLVMLACLPFAWLWLLPQDLKSFSQSFVAVSIFASNFLFWRTSGYFDASAELKPLLHTWSLGVEEQFYILFPLLLMFTWRFGKRWIFAMLALTAVVSFAFSQIIVVKDEMFAFFMLPTRAWELLFGGLIAFYLAGNSRFSVSSFTSQVASAAGLLLLGFYVFAFDKYTSFSGVNALAAPCAAALVIVFATRQTIAGRLLASRPCVGIGLVSYSAYLWHQPLLAFARHENHGDLNQWLLVSLFIGSFVIAYFSWRYVETPFRNKNQVGRKYIFAFGGIGVVGFFTLGLLGHFTSGFETRLTEGERRLLAFESYDRVEIYREGSCFLTPEQTFHAFKKECLASNAEGSILIWGDSHAAALSFGLRLINKNIIQYTTRGCPPLLNAQNYWSPHCKEINDYVVGQIGKIRPTRVVLHANWARHDDTNPFPWIEGTLDLIRSSSPATIIHIVGGIPQFEPSLPRLMFYNRKGLDPDVVLKSYIYPDLLTLDRKFSELSKKHGVKFHSTIEGLCKEGLCQATAAFNGELMPLVWDAGHLTAAGSFLIASRMKFN